ncbi:MAG TPA: ferritin-like domain-containing protein [Polyangiaceae bacterium]|nr:ferritin-like domain-containing protein [Polyangiaceae bacterium]
MTEGTGENGDANGNDAGDGDGASSDGTGNPVVLTCTNPKASENGFVHCDEGYAHRPEVGVCPDLTPRSEPVVDVTVHPDASCVYDADCTGARRYCSYTTPTYPLGQSTECLTGCTTDADCDDGWLCLCGDPVGTCVSAECTRDSDCGPNSLCTSWTVDSGSCGLSTTFSCQQPGDECAGPGDCAADTDCRPNGTGIRTCQAQSLCVIGRPFFVDDAQRYAPLSSRRDWLASSDEKVATLRTAIAALPNELRQRVAAHHARCGQLEHASIAAFARFALELLSLGAPPELLELTHAAQLDETRHARLCFRLAEIYGGAPVGPGPLDLSGNVVGTDLDTIVRGAILEGCIGETIAALEAREAAAQASHPVLAALLNQIADDESRHAELAYRFVRWALERSPELATLLDDALATELTCAAAVDARKPVAAGDSAMDHSAAAHGLLSPASAAWVRARALREVIAPTFRALTSIATSAAQYPYPSEQSGAAVGWRTTTTGNVSAGSSS